VARRIREYGVKRPEWLTHCEICGCAIGDYKSGDTTQRAHQTEDTPSALLRQYFRQYFADLTERLLLDNQVKRLIQCPVCGRFVCVVPTAPELDCWDERRGMCVLCAKEMPRQKACPNCGAVMPQEARFCGICGHKLPEG